MKILVVNCGSSSIKYQLYRMPDRDVLAKGQAERIGEAGSSVRFESGAREHRLQQSIPDHEEGMRLILQSLMGSEDHALDDTHEISAVGHRVVHGGEEFSGSVLIDDTVLRSDRTVCRPGAAAQSGQPDGHSRRHARVARRAARGLFRHGVSRLDSPRGVSVCTALHGVREVSACGATGSTARRTATWPPGPPNCWASRRQPPIASPCTWATAARSRRCGTASRPTRPWA